MPPATAQRQTGIGSGVTGVAVQREVGEDQGCRHRTLADLREAIGNGLEVNPRRVMINNITNELRFDDLEIPARSLIGSGGEGSATSSTE